MLVSADNITKSFGEKTILKDISFTIEEGDKIGLIGENGAGKSTLLNIICDRIEFEQGTITRKSDLKIGFLEQNSGLDRNNTIIEEMHSVYSGVLHMGERLGELEKIISKHEVLTEAEYMQISKEYSILQESFDKNDGYTYEIVTKSILNGMGFADADHNMVISSLSGGEKTRLALAKLLLEKPDLLVLDEPTNHLDFDTLIWLEEYLSSYKGSILVVSHDRYFLDKLVTRIWEVENTKIIPYRGNYSKFKVLREERIKNQLKRYEAQQAQISSMQEYVDKNITRASTSNSAKSRVRALERMELIEKPKTYSKAAKLEFTYGRESVKDVLTVSGLEVEVGALENRNVLARNVSLEVKRGEKIAIIGANGIGKSTFLKSLLGLADISKGDITWGKHVSLSYYDQENLNLNPDRTALDELWNRFPSEIESKIRTNLGRVLLTGDDVFKKSSVLSGGERSKLAFAIILMERCNTLILDEPTNHLDLVTKEVLEASLKDFSGTLIFVSHDRYLLNCVPTKIAELTKDGFIIYEGGFEYYLEKKRISQSNNPDSDQPVTKPKKSRKQQRSEDVKRRNRIALLEQLISEYEHEIESIHREISSPENAANYILISEKCKELGQKESSLEECMDEWLGLVED